jgi:hypothetical protein
VERLAGSDTVSPDVAATLALVITVRQTAGMLGVQAHIGPVWLATCMTGLLGTGETAVLACEL